MRVRASGVAFVCLVMVSAPPLARAQAETLFRVFLRNGDAVPSHGEPAAVGDRVVFTIAMGAPAGPRRQLLVELPASAVDLGRTRRYAHAVRARHYARTRGADDYAAVTEAAAQTIGALASVSDPGLRLRLARQARDRVVDWSRRSYGYRATEVGTLLSLFDGVIAELGAAAGEPAFAFDLVAGPAWGEPEPLAAVPDLRESIRLALSAVTAADDGPVRLAILRGALAVVPEEAAFADLRDALVRRRERETAIDHAYAALVDEVRAVALPALDDGDAAAIDALHDALSARDAELGRARPLVMARLDAELRALAGRAVRHRAALDHYWRVRADLLAFERRLRPVLTALEGLEAPLETIRDGASPSYGQLGVLSARADRLAVSLARTRPPDDLADVHATLSSAIEMARQALDRRRLAAVTARDAFAREASTAAAGALLLAGQARETLVTRLFPPAAR